MNTLLTTKLYFPPVHPNLVPRPRLVQRLGEGLRGPLTLIAAPAGYGKTTLMSAWRASSGRNWLVAWLSLDAGDNDPARFWSYLVSALDSLRPGLMEKVHPILEVPPSPPTEVLLTVLLNNLSTIQNDFMLAIDDVHVIDTSEIYQGLDFMLEHMPPQMHLVLLTRTDPPLALSRLRVRGQIIEIRARDLSFTSEESAVFLNDVMKLELSIGEITTLERRTEGWIAGLQLAALSMQGRDDMDGFIAAFTGGHHYIVDYLIEEVLNRQPEPVRDFLLQTSILDRMTSSLCETLTGQNAGQATLEQLEQKNLFLTSLDDERGWYRYHHLFADVLRIRLQQVHPGISQKLHRRAAAWLEENHIFDQAIDHYQAAGDFPRAAALLKQGMAQIFPGQNLFQIHLCQTMLRWLEAFPEESFDANPNLHIIYARCLWFLGRRTAMEPHYQNAQLIYERLVSDGKITPDDPEFRELPFEILAGRSMSAIYAGNHALAIELAEKALAISLPDNLAAHADVYVSLYLAYRELGFIDKAIVVCNRAISTSRMINYHTGVLDGLNGLGFMLQIQGKLQDSERTFHRALEYATEYHLMWMNHIPVTYFRLSDLQLCWNNLRRAEDYLNKGLELCEQFDHEVIGIFGKIFQSKLQLAQGKKREALETIQGVEKEAHREQISTFDTEIESYRARIQASIGNCSDLAAWVEKIDLSVDEQLGIWQGIRAIQAARVLVALGRIQEALELLVRLETTAIASGSLTCQIEALAVQAVVWHKKGEMTKSQDVLKNALALAASEGYVQVFLNEGAPMAELLRLSSTGLKDAQLASYIDRLLEAFASAPFESDRERLLDQRPGGQLSDREIEILLLVAAGKSNQEIADELVIALGTVKRHVFNIFNKLDVRNRTECVAQARALHLLE